MTKYFAAVAAAVLFAAGVAVAAEPPATLTFDTKNGKVTLNHKAHAEKLPDGCKTCHADGKGGKIAGFSKDVAHGLCKTCHEKGKKGPTKCADCHKKA